MSQVPHKVVEISDDAMRDADLRVRAFRQIAERDVLHEAAVLERLLDRAVAEAVETMNDEQTSPKLADIRNVVRRVFAKYFGRDVDVIVKPAQVDDSRSPREGTHVFEIEHRPR